LRRSWLDAIGRVRGYLEALSPRIVLLTGLLLVLLIGITDYLSGPDTAFAIFYLIPIMFVTWFSVAKWGVVISTLSAISWLLADLLSGHHYPNPVYPIWNAVMRLGIFLIVVAILASLKKSREELERTNNELRGFAHTVSHDLKGPISTTKVASDTLQKLLREPLTDRVRAEIQELGVIVGNNIQNSARLIDDILALSEAGQEPRDAAEVDVRGVVERVLEERSAVINEKRISVKVDGELGKVVASPTQVYQIFANLIGNAIKHNDNVRPSIEISHPGTDEKGRNRYLVRDNGSAIPPEELESIFIPFFKGKTGETGIGLSTVEKIVKIYGGDIRAYNDRGACFEFLLEDYVVT
jgi:signal transduction histidine kinase